MKFAYILVSFSATVTIFLCQTVSSEENWFAEDRTNCTRNVTVERKSITLPTQECKENYRIRFNASDKDSILKLRAEISSNGTLQARIFESELTEDRDVLRRTWNVTDTSEKLEYLSRTPAVLIDIVFTGDWSDGNLTLFCEEHHFRVIATDVPEQKRFGRTERTPNQVFLYVTEGGSPGKKIEMTLHELSINAEEWDYLLIGSGTMPFQGYPPLFVEAANKSTTFYVDDNNAYIALVTGPSEEERSIEISWKYTEIAKDDTLTVEDPFGILNSTKICFNNVTAAVTGVAESIEFKNMNFTKFKAEFLKVAQNYTRDNNMAEITEKLQKLNYTSVVLQELEHQTNSSHLQALILVKSRQERKSLLTQKHLDEIIQNCIESCSSAKEMDITVCRKKEYHDLIYLCIPIAAVCFLAVWAYQRKVFHGCIERKDPDGSREPIRAESNEYVTTPNACQDEEHESPQTSENNQTQVKEIHPTTTQPRTITQLNVPSIEIHVPDAEIPSTPQRAEQTKPNFSNLPFVTRRRRRSSLPPMTKPEEQFEEIPLAIRNETTDDHVYDSLRNKKEKREELATSL